jgi:O-Antigen ligase
MSAGGYEYKTHRSQVCGTRNAQVRSRSADDPLVNTGNETVVEDDLSAPSAETLGDLSLAIFDWLAIAIAGLVPILYLPNVLARHSVPKLVLLLAIVGPGLVALSRLLRVRDRSARCAAAFIAVALVSTLRSPAVRVSFFGAFGWGNGWLFAVSLVSVWAIGRNVSVGALEHIGTAAVAAATVNAVLGIVTKTTGWGHQALTYGDRVSSLVGNPVHLSALCAATFVIAGHRLLQRQFRYAPICVLLIVGVQLAGGRLGLGLVGVGMTWLVWQHGRHRVLLMAAGIAAVAVGVPVAGGASALGRIGKMGADTGLRYMIWTVAARAFRDKPLLGHGLGRFDQASGPFRTNGWGFCADIHINDAHNVVLEALVGVGVVGTVLLAGWLVGLARRARGPYAVVGLVVLLSGMLEPTWHAVTPVALVLLGAAAPRLTLGLAATAAKRSRWLMPLAIATSFAAAVYLVAEVSVVRAINTADAALIDSAARFLPPTTKLEEAVIKIHAAGGPGARLGRAEDLNDWDTTEDETYINFARAKLKKGDKSGAVAALDRALVLNPASLTARWTRAKLVDGPDTPVWKADSRCPPPADA